MRDDSEEGNELGDEILQPESWSLEDGECLALTPRTHPAQLCVDSGRVWATIEEDAEDHFLSSRAQMLLLPVDRLAVLEAWGPMGARGRVCRQSSAGSSTMPHRSCPQAAIAARFCEQTDTVNSRKVAST
jgi:hypothetical protein